MTTTTTTTTAKPLTFAEVRASLPDYFTLTIGAAYAGAYEKGAALETFAASLAASAVEIAHSGNKNGLTFLRAKVDSLTLEKKHARAAVLRSVLTYLEGIKPQSMKTATLEGFTEYADGMHASVLAILVPVASTKPKAKPTNWKQECLNARAERDALAVELASMKQAMETLQTKLAHRESLTA